MFIPQEGLESGKVVTEGFSRGCGGYHHHMAAPPDMLPHFPLVGIDPGNPPFPQGGGDRFFQILRKGHIGPPHSRQKPVFDDIRGKSGIPENLFQFRSVVHVLLYPQEGKNVRRGKGILGNRKNI